MVFIFNRNGNNANAAKTHREILAEYGENPIPKKKTTQLCFLRFKNGHFHFNDKERSGRPIKLDEDWLSDLLYENHRQITRELAV